MGLFFLILGGAIFVLGLLQFVGLALVILSFILNWSPRTHAWVAKLVFVPILTAMIVAGRRHARSWHLVPVLLVCVVGPFFLLLGLLLLLLSHSR